MSMLLTACCCRQSTSCQQSHCRSQPRDALPEQAAAAYLVQRNMPLTLMSTPAQRFPRSNFSLEKLPLQMPAADHHIQRPCSLHSPKSALTPLAERTSTRNICVVSLWRMAAGQFFALSLRSRRSHVAPGTQLAAAPPMPRPARDYNYFS